MNRRELVKVVAAHGGLDAKQVDATLRNLTEVITAVVAKGEPVSITGFAKFAKVDRPARMGRNPATGERLRIKASKKARITPLKAFKDAVVTPRQAPKLAGGVWSPSTGAGAGAGAKSAAAAAITTSERSSRKKSPAKKAAARRR